MEKRIIKLNEKDLHKIVNKTLNENYYQNLDTFTKKDVNNMFMEVIGKFAKDYDESSAHIVNSFRKKFLGLNESIIKESDDEYDNEDGIYPDEENDAFISSDGNKYSAQFSGKFLGHFDELDDAFASMRQAFDDSPNYNPTLWFVTDHGTARPINLKGEYLDL
jgi:hypothetical protein